MSCRPSELPARLTAGDTWAWDVTLCGYKPSDEWTLTCVFRAADNTGSAIEIASDTTTGGTFSFLATPEQTAPFTARQYKFWRTVERDGEKYTVGGGLLTVDPDPTTAADVRTQNEIDLAEAQAALKAIRANPNSSYTTTSGTFTKQNLDALRKEVDRLRTLVQKERGNNGSVTIRTRFGASCWPRGIVVRR